MTERKKAHAIGIDHVSIEVGNIAEAIAFYGQFLEFRVEDVSEDMASIELGDQFIAFTRGRNQGGDSACHFGLVVDDREAVRRALADIKAHILPGRLLTFIDPWGNQIEVVGYGNSHFTKSPQVLRAMGIAELPKTERVERELTEMENVSDTSPDRT
jgi:catechol 2,3-dioxygenase-like lactoylglutathione lyase family enzyme